MTKHLLFACVLSICVSPLPAGDWLQWRGPFFNGSTDETGLPEEWSRTENIAWSVTLPGVAASTPVISEDRVLLTGTDSARDMLQAMCLNRKTGEVLWQHDVAKGISKDYRSNFAAASAVTDGRLAFFFFGSGELVAYGMDGQQRWARNLEEDYGSFAFLWTFSSSPLLFNGKLYVQVLQRDVPVEGRGLAGRFNESYLLALDPPTGKTLWRHVRPSRAVAESREAFSTPIPYTVGDVAQLLVIGGDDLTGHDPETGKELWRWGTWNPERIPHWRLVPSPVAGDGIILACAPKRDPVYAVRAGGSGLLDDDCLAWVSREAREVSADVPTPAFYDGDFFVLSDVRKNLSRVEPRTGQVKWTVPTPGNAKYEASPLAADGKLYTINFDGQVAIFRAADGQLLRTIPMDEPTQGEMVRSSIVAAHGQLFIRTTRHLYCVGKTP
jgi:outer membrane protein assembly factor BamB